MTLTPTTFIIVSSLFCQSFLSTDASSSDTLGQSSLSSISTHDVDPDNLICSTVPSRGVPAIPCKKGKTCVITSFGNPPIDIPDRGLCRDLSSSPPSLCSLSFCASAGSKAACKVPSPPANVLQTVITCRLWTETKAGNCNSFVCQEDCPNNAISSFGVSFCNTCILQVASCRAKFSFTGPIDVKGECSKNQISPFLSAFCCNELGKGCVRKGEKCFIGGFLPSPPCEHGTTCVFTDFGMPAVDSPSIGTCQKIPPKGFIKCNAFLCAKWKGRGVCDIDGSVATCVAWGTRRDNGRKPNCNFPCDRFCPRKESSHKVASRRCKECLFLRKFCLSGFTQKS